MRTRREGLMVLEAARQMGQYGLPGVDRDMASVAFETAVGVVKLVEGVWARVGAG